MQKHPLVSIVIPVHNHPQWLREALRHALGQTYDNTEIIVVDDGSEDDIHGMDILKHDKIRYFRTENHGAAHARNFGMNQAEGKYIAFLDSDDFWKRNKLSVQISQMEKYQAGWSQHSYYYFDDRRRRIVSRIDTYQYRKYPEKFLYTSFKVQTSCFVVRKDAVQRYGCRFDENLAYGEDAAFYRQMLEHYPLLCIDKCLGYFRIRDMNSGFDVKNQMKSRADTWDNRKENDFFMKQTAFPVKMAYLYCSVCNRRICSGAGHTYMYDAVYLIPWSIFKMASGIWRIRTKINDIKERGTYDFRCDGGI